MAISKKPALSPYHQGSYHQTSPALTDADYRHQLLAHVTKETLFDLVWSNIEMPDHFKVVIQPGSDKSFFSRSHRENRLHLGARLLPDPAPEEMTSAQARSEYGPGQGFINDAAFEQYGRQHLLRQYGYYLYSDNDLPEMNAQLNTEFKGNEEIFSMLETMRVEKRMSIALNEAIDWRNFYPRSQVQSLKPVLRPLFHWLRDGWYSESSLDPAVDEQWRSFYEDVIMASDSKEVMKLSLKWEKLFKELTPPQAEAGDKGEPGDPSDQSPEGNSGDSGDSSEDHDQDSQNSSNSNNSSNSSGSGSSGSSASSSKNSKGSKNSEGQENEQNEDSKDDQNNDSSDEQDTSNGSKSSKNQSKEASKKSSGKGEEQDQQTSDGPSDPKAEKKPADGANVDKDPLDLQKKTAESDPSKQSSDMVNQILNSAKSEAPKSSASSSKSDGKSSKGKSGSESKSGEGQDGKSEAKGSKSGSQKGDKGGSAEGGSADAGDPIEVSAPSASEAKEARGHGFSKGVEHGSDEAEPIAGEWNTKPSNVDILEGSVDYFKQDLFPNRGRSAPNPETVMSVVKIIEKMFSGKTRTVSSQTPSKKLSVRHLARNEVKYIRREDFSRGQMFVDMVVDCSGSMNGPPMRNAKVLVAALSELAKKGVVKGRIIFSSGEGWMACNLPMKPEHIERINAFSGSEGIKAALYDNTYKLRVADTVFVYTDAQITDSRFDQKELAFKKVEPMGLYVGSQEAEPEMRQYFNRYIIRDDIKELANAMVQRFLMQKKQTHQVQEKKARLRR